MPVIRCGCGARYRVPDSARGKRVRCKKCGQAFTVPTAKPAAPDALDNLSALADGAAIETGRPATPRASGSPPDYAAALGGGTSADAIQPPPSPEGYVSAAERAKLYFASIGRNCLFNLKFGNLATFLVVWVIMCIQPFLAFGCLLGVIGMIIIQFWFMAFCMNAVLDGAAGENDLTQPNITGGWLDEVVVPGFKFLLTLVIVRLPAVIYLFITALPGGIALDELAEVSKSVFMDPFEALGEESSAGEITVLAGLYLGGAFFWPMVMLIVAVGGIGGLVRIDLILKTIVKSFPAYLCTVVLVYISLLLPLVYLAAGVAAVGSSLSGLLLLGFLLIGVETYATILAMRVIGLYYHHFKHRFAWSWG